MRLPLRLSQLRLTLDAAIITLRLSLPRSSFQRTLSFFVRICATLTSSGGDPAAGIDGRDSNPHLAVLETAALPLSYAYICHRCPDLNREASGPSQGSIGQEGCASLPASAATASPAYSSSQSPRCSVSTGTVETPRAPLLLLFPRDGSRGSPESDADPLTSETGPHRRSHR